MAVLDAQSRPRVLVGSTGADPAWGTVVQDETGANRAVLGMMGEQGAGLGILGPPGTVSAWLGIDAGGQNGGLGLTDAQGKACFGFGTGPTGTGLSLKDANGRDRAAMGIGTQGGAGFTAYDDAGVATWSAP